jgi:oligopeptidase A
MSGRLNPLLSQDDLPRFDMIAVADIAPAVKDLVRRCEAALEQGSSNDTPATYEALAAILDPAMQGLNDAWGVVEHLCAVADNPELRAAHASVQPAVTALSTRIASDLRLFHKYQLAAAEGADRLGPAQRRKLNNDLRAFRLAGAELAADDKHRFAANLMRSAEISKEFGNRLLDATDQFVYWAKEAELSGVPDDVMHNLRDEARSAGRDDGAYKLSLHQPCLGPLMRFAHDRGLREMLYRANVTRASQFGPATLDNTALISETLALRQERARLLGKASHAEVSLVPKMADTPQQVIDFLTDLGRRSQPQAERELAELKAFAAESLGLSDLQPWDLAYAGEKLREARYAFSAQEVKLHFTLDKVLAGLFTMVKQLFNVRFIIEQQATWHPEATAYRVERSGELLGRLLLDPFARSRKQGGAWMNGARPRWKKPDGSTRVALAYIVTNFARPAQGQPAFLSHGEVVTLFHEFGHALHFLLSRVDVLGVSGISGVEWDAVELPSQLMENFAWQWPVLQQITAHPDTGAPISRELFDKLCAARHFHCSLELMRQLELSMFDMRVHAEPAAGSRVQAVMDEVRSVFSPLLVPAYNRSQNGFSHIFNGGYAAGYYSYLWADVLASDGWEEFERAGTLDAGTAQRYLHAVLERGGSRPMLENFIEFVGRAPGIDAMLRQRGIAPASSSGSIN